MEGHQKPQCSNGQQRYECTGFCVSRGLNVNAMKAGFIELFPLFHIPDYSDFEGAKGKPSLSKVRKTVL